MQDVRHDDTKKDRTADGAFEGEVSERRLASGSLEERYHYHTYGFDIASQIPLPELTQTPPCASPDIEIVAGEVNDALEGGRAINQWLQLGEHQCQVWVDGIARYRIEEGRRIVIDRRDSGSGNEPAAPSDIRVYLLGTAFGVLAHQRGWLPLHVSAIKAPNGVWAFTGESGAGKSTLSAWLHHYHGCDLVTDDVAVIKPADAEPLLYPGPRKVKLWKQTLAALKWDTRGAQRDLTRIDKYHLTLEASQAPRPEPLRALVVLERGGEDEPAQLAKVQGPEALFLLLEALYRPEMGRSYNPPEAMMRDCQALAERIRVYRYRRPWDLQEVSRSLEPLLHQMDLTIAKEDL